MEKITTVILGCCLLGWGNNLSAQSNTVASGGNATGAGGSASYSIGQAFILTNSGGSYSVSEGLQQSKESMQTLPVTWLTFDAKPVNQQVQLKWATASELNNKFFEIERSADGITFTKLATVNGAGNSNSTNNYSFLDKNPLNGTSYYRITQVDNDGKTTYSEIKPVEIGFKNNALAVYPNPVADVLEVRLYSDKSKAVTLSLYDINGRKVGEKLWSMTNGTNQLKWDMGHLPTGVYLLSIPAEGIATVKIIKK